jgi:GAF domain-containing protein
MEMSNSELEKEITFLDEDAQDFIAAVGHNLAGRQAVDVILNRIMLQVAEFLGAEAASIFVVDQSTDDLVLIYATGEVRDEVVGLRLESGKGVVGWVVKYGEDLIVPYPGLDVRFFEGVDERTGFSTRSILCGPMRVNGHTLGAIEVLNKKDGTFNDDDLVVLRAIARLVAKYLVSTGA